MLLFISPAHAQSGAPDPIMSFLFPLLLVLPIFYFLVIRPQQQKVKQHRDMVEKVRRAQGRLLETSDDQGPECGESDE